MKKIHFLVLILAFLIGVGLYLFVASEAEAPTIEEKVLENNISTMTLALTSPVFENDGTIPSKFTCDGENINPPLSISGVPEGAESLVLVMDDPDIPEVVKESRGIEKFDHWVLYNLSADTDIISEGVEGSVGKNSTGVEGYTGPCPPTQYEPTEHRYVFRLYAIKGQLNFIASPTLDEVEAAAQGSMIEKTELVGRYSRVD